jgi:hypothetical protein
MGGVLTWFHFGEGEYAATEEAIQAELRELDALRELPPPMPALRPTDAPGAGVMAPSGEAFPGGSWERPWTAGEDGEELTVRYEAGGAFATIEPGAGAGGGSVELRLDGEPAEAIAVDIAALYPLAEHPRHQSHEVTLRPSPGLRIWSLSFAAGTP